MPSAGGVSPPTIIALKHSGVVPGNKIDTNTYIEITTETRGCRIYFSTDGTRPLPKGSSVMGVKNTTHKYTAPFTMRAGNRLLKAICVSKYDLRESAVVTKNYKVAESKYSGTSESDSSFSDSTDYMLMHRSKSTKICKPNYNANKTNYGAIGQSSSKCKQIQVPTHEKLNKALFTPNTGIPHSSINYSGTQINIWGPTPPGAIEELSRGLNKNAHNQNQKIFGANQSGNYNGYLTEEMLRKTENRQLLTVGDLKNALMRSGPQIEEVQEKVPIEYKEITDPPISNKSPGNGDWRGQLTHLYAHLTSHAKLDNEFLADLSYAKFGKIISSELVNTDDGYHMSVYLENAAKSQAPIRKPEKKTTRIEPPPKVTREKTPEQPAKPKTPTLQPKKPVPKNTEPYYMTENYEQSGTVLGVDDLNPDENSSILRKAMKGIGTDEKALINILCTRTNIQRQKIAAAYKSNYGRDLKEDIRGETSGNFRAVLLALLEEGVEYDAKQLNKAIKGLGTDEDTLVEIICTRTSQQLEAIKTAYEKLFKRTLEKDVVDDTSGNFQRIMVSLLQNTRDSGDTYDLNKVKEDVKALQKAGKAKWGTDESVFNKIIVNRSFAYLRALFEQYLKETGHQFEDVLKNEMSGDLLQAFLAVVRCINDKPAFYAKKLSDAMKGLGTKDDTLIRIIVSRCEVDLVQIKERFHTLTNKILNLSVKGETSGDYQTALLMLIGK